MKTTVGIRWLSGCFGLLLQLGMGTGIARSQAIPFAVSFWYPTNGQGFVAPATVGVHALVTDSNVVRIMQYFSGTSVIGTVTNAGSVLLTNSAQGSPFFMSWSNVQVGGYTLRAVALDSMGRYATSAPVNVSVTSAPPVVIRPSVYIYSPTNRSSFGYPTNVMLYARAAESTGTVATVQFFANSVSLGTVSNSSQTVFTNISTEPLFPLTWSNAPVGSFALTALATDAKGMTATSSVVNITVVTNTPPPVIRPSVYIYSPTNGTSFVAPAAVGIYVHALESTGTIATVQFFANSTSLGVVSNNSQMVFTNISSVPLFPLVWSNAPAGSYALTALATDAKGMTATSSVVNISVVTSTPPPVVHPSVGIYSPTNGTSFVSPAAVGIYARAVESTGTVASVQFYANSIYLGSVSNSSQAVFTNISSVLLFPISWSNAPVGSYALKAIATDANGQTATSALVNITVMTNAPTPPVIPFYVSFWYPTNGQKFAAPATIGVHALVTDSNVVRAMQYFANGTSIGVVTNGGTVPLTNSTQSNPFFMSWSNVPAGSYTLTALAMDSAGNLATSAPVTVTVTNVPAPVVPFAVSFWYPTNGQMFLVPATIGVHAKVTDSNVVQTVQYFASGTSIGLVTNSAATLLTNSTQGNPFFLAWSNVPAGNYVLTALATDSAGHSATSGPVSIFVLTNLPPVVSIYAPDPVAIEGTNYGNWYSPTNATTNYISGANTATFLVRRDTATNTALTVYYTIGGTAINGVDYVTLPTSVTIPAGQRYALITSDPLDDMDSSYRPYDTVILSLLLPPTAYTSPLTYSVGTPASAGAIILEENFLPMPNPVIRNLPDSSLHVSLPATNGMNFCLQISTDLLNWIPVCTNTVLKGSAQYVDPGSGNAGLYYRIVPVNVPGSY